MFYFFPEFLKRKCVHKFRRFKNGTGFICNKPACEFGSSIRTHYLLTGALLPIWAHIGNVRNGLTGNVDKDNIGTVRVQLDNGTRFCGIKFTREQLRRLQIFLAQMKGEAPLPLEEHMEEPPAKKQKLDLVQQQPIIETQRKYESSDSDSDSEIMDLT